MQLACSCYVSTVSFHCVIVNDPLLALLPCFNCSLNCPGAVWWSFLCKTTIDVAGLLAHTVDFSICCVTPLAASLHVFWLHCLGYLFLILDPFMPLLTGVSPHPPYNLRCSQAV